MRRACGAVAPLLIDALDELPTDGSLGRAALLADHFPRPQRVRVIVTPSRDETRSKGAAARAHAAGAESRRGAEPAGRARFSRHIASQHVAKTMSIADLEIAAEAKFPGTNIPASWVCWSGSRSPCYDKAVDAIKDPDYEQLQRRSWWPTNLGQSVSDMDTASVAAAHEKLRNAAAKEWQDGKPFAFLRVP